MAEERALQALLKYVLKKYIWTEVIPRLGRARRINHLDMKIEDINALIGYIEKWSNCSHDQAVKSFKDAKLEAESSLVQEADKKVGVSLLVSCIIGMAVGGSVSTLLLLLGLGTGLAALIGLSLGAALFFCLLFRWVWNPRYRAMNEVWNSGGDMEDHLDELYELLRMPLGQLILQRQKKQLMMFIGGIAAVPIILALDMAVIMGTTSVLNGETEENAQTEYQQIESYNTLQEEMAALTVSTDNEGTRYVACLTADGSYTNEYIPEVKRAATASDVRAVLRITAGEEAVGTYKNYDPKYDVEDGIAYKRYVNIELVDQRTGSVVLAVMVYGGEPPLMSFLYANQTKLEDGYGSEPSSEDIAAACEQLIAAFESNE